MNLSVVILTKNEEKNIVSCLKSCLFANELIIIDDCSTDNTIKLARKYTSKIYQRKLNNDFSQQRNFGLKKAKNDWVLFLDADERITSKLKQEIKRGIKDEEINGYYLLRQDIFLNKLLKHGETGKLKLLRLGQRKKGFWQRAVHETWVINEKTKTLKNPLIHYSHQNISSMLEKLNYYSTINANYLYQKKGKISPMEIIIYPSTKFILNYLLKAGFLDGTRGLIFAIMMSFHSFLTRVKLYFLTHEK